MDDYDDDDYYDEDGWFYVEDTLLLADSLAEGAVGSPPPTFVADEDAEDDWDRFDYYNDLEYDSDGYDDVKFQASRSLKGAIPGQKRKRREQNTTSHSRKKQKLGKRAELDSENAISALKPVVWRSQGDRELEVKQFDDRHEPFSLLSDWRVRLQEPPLESSALGLSELKSQEAFSEQSPPPAEGEDQAGEDIDVDPKALMTILQSRLGEAGGPLSGMDTSKLLEYAMRMMNENETSDDIAGQLAEDMMEQVDEDEEDAPAELTTWLAQQRGDQAVDSVLGTQNNPRDGPSSPKQTITKAESSKSTSSLGTSDRTALRSGQVLSTNQEPSVSTSRKRKAEENENQSEDTTNVPEAKRAARSYDAPTAASRARVAPPSTSTRNVRSDRGKRS